MKGAAGHARLPAMRLPRSTGALSGARRRIGLRWECRMDSMQSKKERKRRSPLLLTISNYMEAICRSVGWHDPACPLLWASLCSLLPSVRPSKIVDFPRFGALGRCCGHDEMTVRWRSLCLMSIGRGQLLKCAGIGRREGIQI